MKSPQESNTQRAAVDHQRLVRPLPISGEADCPRCGCQKSVSRHNADWACQAGCGFHELVDPDRECEHKFAAAGLNTGRCIKCDAVKHFQTNVELVHHYPRGRKWNTG